jgi:hypothetical protein
MMAILIMTSLASGEWNEKVLYSFQGGTDGQTPAGGVVFDKAGNLYGANSWGGSGGCPSPGCGTVVEISPPGQKGGAWIENTIYAFQGVLGGVKDGLTPEGGVIIDRQGNLYGTATLGGNGPCILLGSAAGCGIVYELSPPTQKGGPWTETILYNFQGGNDGYFPIGDLVFDRYGSLYGATWFGGGRGTSCDTYYGGNCGTVFKLTPPKQKGGTWTEKILHRFAGGKDGANPNGGLVLDSKGAVYGTTQMGGDLRGECKPNGCGTVFRLTPPVTKGGTWTEEMLHRFTGHDGATPNAGLILDAKGSLYGTSNATVFRLMPPNSGSGPWRQTILYIFGILASSPGAGLTFDARGNLYGTTEVGFASYGTVYRLKEAQRNRNPFWTFSQICGFLGPPGGAHPAANLIFDKHGNLYSTTQYGGSGACQGGCGTVFEVSP